MESKKQRQQKRLFIIRGAGHTKTTIQQFQKIMIEELSKEGDVYIVRKPLKGDKNETN